MENRRRRIPLLTLFAAFALVSAGGRAQARGADAQPPPSAPVVGGWVPAEIVHEIDPVDYGSPGYQENLAEGDTQSGTPKSGATGTVLASDNFSAATGGLLPSSSSRPAQWKVGYLNGEYQIASVGSGSDLDDTALISGTYGDVSIAVDARIVQGTATAPDQTARIYCRRQASGSGFTGYRLQFSPVTNGWALYRGDGNSGVTLTDVQFLRATPSPAATHHLVLTCSGSTISVTIDGTPAGSFQDRSYSSGSAALGVGNFTLNDSWKIYPPGSAYPGTYDTRFGKLVLTQP